MNSQTLPRLFYRLLLRLHPSAFRRRFGGEMLWIFDLAASKGDTFYLLFDGARSLIIQRARLDPQEETATPFGLEIPLAGLTVARISQAAVLISVILLALASLMARQMPPHIDQAADAVCGQNDTSNTTVLLEIRQ